MDWTSWNSKICDLAMGYEGSKCVKFLLNIKIKLRRNWFRDQTKLLKLPFRESGITNQRVCSQILWNLDWNPKLLNMLIHYRISDLTINVFKSNKQPQIAPWSYRLLVLGLFQTSSDNESFQKFAKNCVACTTRMQISIPNKREKNFLVPHWKWFLCCVYYKKSIQYKMTKSEKDDTFKISFTDFCTQSCQMQK